MHAPVEILEHPLIRMWIRFGKTVEVEIADERKPPQGWCGGTDQKCSPAQFARSSRRWHGHGHSHKDARAEEPVVPVGEQISERFEATSRAHRAQHDPAWDTWVGADGQRAPRVHVPVFCAHADGGTSRSAMRAHQPYAARSGPGGERWNRWRHLDRLRGEYLRAPVIVSGCGNDRIRHWRI
ncbi:hypothetical protein BAD_1252 [Bifidobacterium adolescentis ATCC 15703]|uniref:Uncharacterized protein n=1 Tax=Bifidobacterium adolescentis (strain ATCC 15703 / DSM 20083 / NCTC 11814 / E194a) TaxID=367928 RepID=A1A2V0_BIFAA|nr:hypothetical protein BAD_1252 [Bifidobacterium adolescentis ATCC 15703]